MLRNITAKGENACQKESLRFKILFTNVMLLLYHTDKVPSISQSYLTL